MSVSSITPLALAELCKGGRKIDLLDVRTPVEFRELHAAGARNVPLDQLDPAIVMQARNGAGNDPLHVICRAGSRGRHGRSPSIARWDKAATWRPGLCDKRGFRR